MSVGSAGFTSQLKCFKLSWELRWTGDNPVNMSGNSSLELGTCPEEESGKKILNCRFSFYGLVFEKWREHDKIFLLLFSILLHNLGLSTWFHNAHVKGKSLFYTFYSELYSSPTLDYCLYSSVNVLQTLWALIFPGSCIHADMKERVDRFIFSFFLLFYSNLFLSFPPLSFFFFPSFLFYCIWIANVLQILHNCTEEWPFCSPFSVLLYSSRYGWQIIYQCLYKILDPV